MLGMVKMGLFFMSGTIIQ